jgi:hypothetical protein
MVKVCRLPWWQNWQYQLRPFRWIEAMWCVPQGNVTTISAQQLQKKCRNQVLWTFLDCRNYCRRQDLNLHEHG